MYTVTFYSYKGGVGRTMALINVAAELVLRGRKVLIVDFDLEAPGITSYDFCNKAVEAPGIVDYISEYLKRSIAPSVENYVQKCTLTLGDRSSYIWVMPAGLQDKNYKTRFHTINWDHLYSEQSGYLLMENLKAQWEQVIDPDYVLIDSRTGHTDVSGICTRQLPDAVVFTFLPNRQNLSGLKQIVEEVRREKDGPREKKIETLFLASNVSNVDDEHQILEKSLDQFQAELGYEKFNKVRHYDSLELVDQVIFTLDHRRTRLAQEYIELTDAIVMQNAADPQGALAYLADIASNRRGQSWRSIVDRLNDIEEHHPDVGPILSALGHVYEAYDRMAAAITFYEQALELGGASADTYRSLGILYLRAERKEDAILIFKHQLERSDMTPSDVQGALSLLIALNDKSIPELLAFSSVQSLDSLEKLAVVEELRNKPDLLESAHSFTQEIVLSKKTKERHRIYAKGVIPLIEIGLGRYDDALEHLGTRAEALNNDLISVPFNYAMAEWVSTGNPPKDMFARVLQLNSFNDDDEQFSANYYQCLSVACWAVGDVPSAKDWLERSRVLVNGPGFRDREFSCWRYLNVRPDQFLDDLTQILRLIEGKSVFPEFAMRAKTLI